MDAMKLKLVYIYVKLYFLRDEFKNKIRNIYTSYDDQAYIFRVTK